MRKIRIVVALPVVLLFVACVQQNAYRLPVDDPMPDLATPLRLNVDTTVVYLSDYIPDITRVDTVLFHQSLKPVFSHGKSRITITVVNAAELPLLSEMTIKTKQAVYSVLVIKSNKQKVVFKYTESKPVSSVEIAGDINGWNPQATPLTRKNGNWETTVMLSPGNYAYQMVVDGKWMLDPANPDSMSNNIGGYNSIVKVGNTGQKPLLQTVSFNDKFVVLSFSNRLTDIFTFWQNFRIPLKQMKISGNTITLPIPETAKLTGRSYLRITACNLENVSNDVLIPLSHGKVVFSADSFQRTDKHAMIMYFLMIDRFVNGNPKNDRKTPDPAILPKANYYGGDLEGITQTIEKGYFDDLGINTIWISPVTQNPLGAWGQYHDPDTKFSGYHGYWPVTLTTVDFRFGNEQTMKDLVNTCHARNYNLLLDYVAHHIHQEHPLAKQHPEWQTALYLPDGTLNTEQWDKHRLTTWFDVFLPTLDLSKPEVYNSMSDSALFWLSHYKIDGFRHDATKHIPEPFWRTLTLKIKKQFGNLNGIYQIGETYGNRELIGSYVGTGMMDAQFDFNVYDASITVFGKKDQPVSILQQSLQESLDVFGYHNLMGYISGNQDRPRFISLAGGSLRFDENHKRAGWKRNIGVGDTLAYRRLALLHAFNFSIPGIPTIYYGDEFGMPGANDPDNRRMMYFNHTNNHEKWLISIVSQLAKLRRSDLAAIYGTTYLETIGTDILLIHRIYFGNGYTCIINTSGQPQNISFSFPNQMKPTAFEQHFKHHAAINDSKINLQLSGLDFEIITSVLTH